MVALTLTCLIAGEGSIFAVEIYDNKLVSFLKDEIAKKKMYNFPADRLILYLAKKNDAFLDDEDADVGDLSEAHYSQDVKDIYLKSELFMKATRKLHDFFGKNTPDEKVIHVLVLLPITSSHSGQKRRVSLLRSSKHPLEHPIFDKSGTEKSRFPQDVYGNTVSWHSRTGEATGLEGIDLQSGKTLLREDVTNGIIDNLDQKKVIFVKSPPMTGKTSMATLVSYALFQRCEKMNKNAVIYEFSILNLAPGEAFAPAFKSIFNTDWKDVATSRYLQEEIVYLIVDEVQMIFQESGSSSFKCKSSTFWYRVKGIMTERNCKVRILMFAAYGSNFDYLEYSTPIDIPPEMQLEIKDMNLRHDEVVELVLKHFVGVERLQNANGDENTSLRLFCSQLEYLTGSHVGLCITAIKLLNEIYMSCIKSASSPPTLKYLIQKMQDGSLHDGLITTRAVRTLNTLTQEELDCLERISNGTDRRTDHEKIVDTCCRRGILLDSLEFSSPVMKRFFIQKRVGVIKRAKYLPSTLQDLISRALSVIDYECMKNTLGKSALNDIPLETVWKMEFFKSVHRSTPESIVTSADVGAIFGSNGFIDFTVYAKDKSFLWGIELLREGNRIDEHIQRFSSDGRYSSLDLSDFCLIDFRRIDNTSQQKIDEDLRRSTKLYIVCYDAPISNITLYNSQSTKCIQPSL